MLGDLIINCAFKLYQVKRIVKIDSLAEAIRVNRTCILTHSRTCAPLKRFSVFLRILTARETALASRKNCVEEWLAWHTRLRAEEDRVFRMEEAALKLAAATSNVLSQQGNVMRLYVYEKYTFLDRFQLDRLF